jgi:hypothetical protein
MHRFRVPELFLGCFLTVAVFAAGMLFQEQRQAASLAYAEKKREPAPKGRFESPDAELTGSTWLTKDAAGFFTFGLAVIGIGQAILFYVQLRYMRKGMADSTTAAKAADLNARAAVALELPIIRMIPQATSTTCPE